MSRTPGLAEAVTAWSLAAHERHDTVGVNQRPDDHATSRVRIGNVVEKNILSLRHGRAACAQARSLRCTVRIDRRPGSFSRPRSTSCSEARTRRAKSSCLCESRRPSTLHEDAGCGSRSGASRSSRGAWRSASDGQLTSTRRRDLPRSGKRLRLPCLDLLRQKFNLFLGGGDLALGLVDLVLQDNLVLGDVHRRAT